MNQKANPDQKVLCHYKALFNYDPKEDNLHPCAEIGLMFFTGDILAIVNQDDPNWWQVCILYFNDDKSLHNYSSSGQAGRVSRTLRDHPLAGAGGEEEGLR